MCIRDRFHEGIWNGAWMGIASGDLNGDLQDEVVVANFGTQTFSLRNTAVLSEDFSDMNISPLMVINAIDEQGSLHHALLRYSADGRFKNLAAKAAVEHSPYIAPDITLKSNCTAKAHELWEKYNFGNSLTSLEFTWNPSVFDLENDGDLDIYFAGSISRGNDDFIGEFSANPGRLMTNESTREQLKFKDQTLEYRLLDISEMDYDANPPRRKSPGTNWHKRDYIYLQDVDAYADMGLEASRKSKVKDIFRMHESACNTLAADLNNDGFEDLVICHAGGNNSNLPSARNLKVNVMGKVMAMPPPNKVIKAPTNFEEGPTFVYINGGTPKGKTGNWVKILLKDPTTANINGIGAKVIVNDKIMRRLLVGGQSFSAVHALLNIGLGEEKLKKLEIYWASGDMTPQIVEFKQPLVNQIVEVKRSLPSS